MLVDQSTLFQLTEEYKKTYELSKMCELQEHIDAFNAQLSTLHIVFKIFQIPYSKIREIRWEVDNLEESRV
jgi:hypothetical protein